MQETILINEVNNRPNLILTRTFSKIYGLAGLRVGYAIANPEIIKGMKAKWLGSMPTIPSVSSFAAIHALDDIDHLRESKKFNVITKDEIYQIALEQEIQILKSEANFVLIKVGDSVKAEKLLHENGFRLTAGYFFGYPEWLRMSFCNGNIFYS